MLTENFLLDFNESKVYSKIARGNLDLTMCGVFTLEELLSVVRPTETELTTVLYGDAVQVWGLLLPVLGLASREGGEQQSRRYSGVHVWAVSHSDLISLRVDC